MKKNILLIFTSFIICTSCNKTEEQETIKDTFVIDNYTKTAYIDTNNLCSNLHK